MASDVDPERIRLTGTAPVMDRAGPRGPHLVVVEAHSSFPFPLPPQGELLIGRGPEADLPLSEPGASRRHATLTVADGQVAITDLDSRNGTLVNGERLEGRRPLLGGDTVTIGTAMLILYLPPGAMPGRQFSDAPTLHLKLQEELERARLFDRTVGVVALLLAAGADREAVGRRVDSDLRSVDATAWLSATELVVVLPEADEREAADTTRRLLASVGPLGLEVRAGFAIYPTSACDTDALLAAARAAARGAGRGDVADPDAAARVQIGDRSVVVADPATVGLMDLIRRLARTDLPVLVQGETGVGKENAAYALHWWSQRQAAPFVAVNCATFSETLVESELFGSEKGAFSGAVTSRAGLLESAAGGTIFFDEIGELPRALQPKLLRVLETKRAMRVGGTKERELDVRVVAATNRNLRDEVKAGRFREDLLFRLNAATVVLPPLRNRPREIAVLARTFLAEACRRLGVAGKTFAGASLHALTGYPWPGNVRELKNVVEYLAATTVSDVIEVEAARARLDALEPPEAPPLALQNESAESAPAPPVSNARKPTPALGAGAGFAPIADEVRDLERRRMTEALEAAGWVQTRAAELIGMPLRTFQQKAKQYGLRRPG
jgi:two-component system, NtrC family, response regulator AtoC